MRTSYPRPEDLKLYKEECEGGRSSNVGVCVRNIVQGKWHVTEF